MRLATLGLILSACCVLGVPSGAVGAKNMIVVLDRTGSMLDDDRCNEALTAAFSEVGSFCLANPGGLVCVFTFAGSTVENLTGGFVDEAAAVAALGTLSSDGCTGSTPLADAICDACEYITSAFPAALRDERVMCLLTDGEENNSSGDCSGPSSLTGPPPAGNYTEGSWQQMAWDACVAGAIVNVKYWFSVSKSRGEQDVETGMVKAAGVSDEYFFQDLASSSGGYYEEYISGPGSCHDGYWEDAENCGYDCLQVTGEVDMNHDCEKDFRDIVRLGLQMGREGPNLGGDLNDDGVVGIQDVNIFSASYNSGNPITPCNPVPPPSDECAGCLALSLVDTMIVSRGCAAPFQSIDVYVIAQDVVGLEGFEFSLAASSNLYPGNSDPYRWGVSPWGYPATGTMVLGTETYLVLDANPAWIEIISNTGPPATPPRWVQLNPDLISEFSLLRHVGINGPDPVSETTCPGANVSPGLDIGQVDFASWPIRYTVSGSASDSDGAVALVEYRLDEGPWQVATGTNAWSFEFYPDSGENWIQVRARDDSGAYSSTAAQVVNFDGISQVNPSIVPATSMNLRSMPNPFNPHTEIRFTTSGPGIVTVVVFDLTGRRVRCLANHQVAGGEQAITWDGTDDSGRHLPSGVYQVMVRAGVLSSHLKVTLVR